MLSYAGRALLRPQPFADRAVAALRDPAIQRDVAERLTDAIVQSGNGDLVTVRPLVRSVAGAVVDSGAFSSLFRRAALDAHRAVIESDGESVQLRVADAGVLIAAALERLEPETARRLRAEKIPSLLTFHPGGAVLGISRAAERARTAAWILAVLAVLAAAGAIWLSPDRRRTTRALGIGLMVGGLAIVLVLLAGRAAAVHAAPEARAGAVRAIWEAFLGGLRVQALWLAAAGAICAAAASGRVRPARIDAKLLKGWRLLTASAPSRRHRLTRAVGLVALGAALVSEPAATLTFAALVTGIYLLYRGIGELVGEAAPATRPSAGVSRSWRTGLRRALPAALAVGALAGVLALLASGEGDGAPSAPALACDGRAQLCARPLNDVALPATHNSMSSVTIPTFLFGQQDGTIAEQLADGIRGLLIDTYHGEAVPGGVRTELGRPDSAKRKLVEREIGAPATEAALRIRARLGHQGAGTPGIFLCHAFCELGAVPLDSALADIRSFLVSNPEAVLVVINQDEGVTPAEIAEAFTKAGLLDLVYRRAPGPFPTLRSMIDSNERLVVMAENEASDQVSWYHLAYAHALQETPYSFRSAAQLTDPAKLPASCRPHRGPASAPLFLLNHWVDTTPTPRISLAAKVNAREPLLKRAQTCQIIRDRLPNLVAVDFYRRGDVFGVVDTLNGLSR